MKDFFLKVLATVTAAAIVANVAVLFNLSARLTRIEAKLELSGKLTAQK